MRLLNLRNWIGRFLTRRVSSSAESHHFPAHYFAAPGVALSTARLVVTATMTAMLSACGSQPGTGSALREPPPHGWSIAVEVDRPFTDGLEVLIVDDDGGPVTVDRVDVIGSDHLEVVGFQLALPERELGAVQFFDAFPPNLVTKAEARESLASIEPIDQEPPLVVPDHPEGAELLLGLVATATGRLERSAIRVVYTRDGVAHQQVFPAELVVCASPRVDSPADCPLEGFSTSQAD